MRSTVLFLSGFLAGLLAHTLFGNFAFISLALLYGVSLYLLFFIPSPHTKTSYFLLGLTVYLELFTGRRLGLASLLALSFLVLQNTLGQRLRLTSLYAHYLAALSLGFLAYNLLLFPSRDFFSRLTPLLFAWSFTALTAYFFSTRQEEKSYNLI